MPMTHDIREPCHPTPSEAEGVRDRHALRGEGYDARSMDDMPPLHPNCRLEYPICFGAHYTRPEQATDELRSLSIEVAAWGWTDALRDRADLWLDHLLSLKET